MGKDTVMVIDPTFDKNGYPTEATLETVRVWPWTDRNGWLDFVKSCWHWPCYTSHRLNSEEKKMVHHSKGKKFLRLATGTWSGNESLIAAMRENQMLWSQTW